MNWLLWTSSLWFSRVCLLNSVCRDTLGDAGGERHTTRPPATPSPGLPGRAGMKAGNICSPRGWPTGRKVSVWTQPDVTLRFAVISLCFAVTDPVIINNAGGDTHGAEKQHFTLGSSVHSQNLLQYSHFYCAKYKSELQKKKKGRDSGLSRTYSEKEKSIYFYSMELRVASWDQNISILECYNNQQFLLIHTAHRQNLHYYLTIGLIICLVKIVGFIVKAVTLSASASVDFSRWPQAEKNPSGVCREARHVGLLSNMLG